MSDEKKSKLTKFQKLDAEKKCNSKNAKINEVPEDVGDVKNTTKQNSEQPEIRYVFEVRDDDSWLFSCRWPTAQFVPENPQLERVYTFVETLGEIKDKLVQLESYRKTLRQRVAAGKMTPQEMETEESDMHAYVCKLNERVDALVQKNKARQLPNLYQRLETAKESLVTMEKLAALFLPIKEKTPERSPPKVKKYKRRDNKGSKEQKPPRDPNKPKRQYRKRKTIDTLVPQSTQQSAQPKRKYRKRNASAPDMPEGGSSSSGFVHSPPPKRQYRKRNTGEPAKIRVRKDLKKPKRKYRKRETSDQGRNASSPRSKRQYRKRKEETAVSPQVLDLSMQKKEEEHDSSE